MAIDEKHFKNIDLRENELKNAKVANTPDIPLETPTVVKSNVAGENYVDEGDTYHSSIEDLLNPGSPRQNASVTVGNISAGTSVNNKKFRELFDMLFHPRQRPSYVLPTSVFSFITQPGQEVGELTNVALQHLITFNDSIGGNSSTPYGWSGGSFPAIVQNSVNNITNFAYATKPGNNNYAASFSYLGSNVKNDSYGDPDSFGIFGNGILNKSLNVIGYWPWFVHNGSVLTVPTTSSEIRNASNYTKNVSAVPSGVFNLVVIGDNTSKNVIIVVPDQANTASIQVIKDGALPISASFIRSRILNVQDLNSTGQLSHYTVFHHSNGIGYNSNSTYTVTITP